MARNVVVRYMCQKFRETADKMLRYRCPANAASILYVGCCWFHDTPDGDLNAFPWN